MMRILFSSLLRKCSITGLLVMLIFDRIEIIRIENDFSVLLNSTTLLQNNYSIPVGWLNS